MHALKGAVLAGNHALFSLVWHGLDPCQVVVNLMQDPLVIVAAAGAGRELAGLVREQVMFYIVDFHNDVFLFLMTGATWPSILLE